MAMKFGAFTKTKPETFGFPVSDSVCTATMATPLQSSMRRMASLLPASCASLMITMVGFGLAVWGGSFATTASPFSTSGKTVLGSDLVAILAKARLLHQHHTKPAFTLVIPLF